MDPKNVPLIYLPPPPADLPEWSDSEVMPLIIIENSSAVEKLRTTDGLLPVGSSRMDTTTTVPIYSIPKDSNIGIDQSAVPTVFASGVSPDSIPWSTVEDIIRDIIREGPFDAGATPMETEDCPLISTSMPGCPYRMTSYTGAAMVDADTTYGLQLHHPWFLEFIGAPESARLLNH